MYSTKVLLLAAKVSFIHMTWLVSIIGVPMIYFDKDLQLSEKVGLFVFFLVFLWLIYFLTNMLFHRLSLRKPEALEVFLSKDEAARSKELGTHLEYW